MTFKPNEPHTLQNTTLETWFERDRAHVALISRNGKTLIEWWDEDVNQAIEDGFLSDKGFIMGREIDPAPLHRSAFEYWKSLQ